MLSSELESKGYVDLTISILADFGVSVIETATGWHIPGGQKYCARRYMVEGDWSQAAFFLCLAALGGGKIQIAGLLESSHQGDRACVSPVSYTHLQNRTSLVGRTQSRSESFSSPPCVTQATSGAKPSTWSFSRCRRLSGINIGIYTF